MSTQVGRGRGRITHFTALHYFLVFARSDRQGKGHFLNIQRTVTLRVIVHFTNRPDQLLAYPGDKSKMKLAMRRPPLGMS